MQHFDKAWTFLSTYHIADAGLLLLITGLFCGTVYAYLRVSGFFQSRRRRGFFSGDGMAFALAGTLFLAFTGSFLEIFALSFRLPFGAYPDLLIGLGAVAAAVVLARLLALKVANQKLQKAASDQQPT
ncbi:hypothetical protein [Labrenzia sp. VG12]|uniref:hypothetical protein n=1 Tax=Labrenzia sp. VG12 TaxID=2021862 RepID=UPI0012FE49CD|nr:hypothetical protein [Labrenzia sp. VG12]